VSVPMVSVLRCLPCMVVLLVAISTSISRLIRPARTGRAATPEGLPYHRGALAHTIDIGPCLPPRGGHVHAGSASEAGLSCRPRRCEDRCLLCSVSACCVPLYVLVMAGALRPVASTVQPCRVETIPMGPRLVPHDVDFVYVMRRDSEYVARQIAARLDAPDSFELVRKVYDTVVDRLAQEMLLAFREGYERPSIDLLDPGTVEHCRRELIRNLGGGSVVSMDPLMAEDAVPLAFSRCYDLGGTQFIEMIARPGYPEVSEQVARIRSMDHDQLILVEDDIFTGETISTVVSSYLGDVAESIIAVVAGTKIGTANTSYPVHAAVEYRCDDDVDPTSKVDLGDPRDYVVGTSGLVCRLPSGALGRLPYVLPFVSPAARATVPIQAELSLSRRVIALSHEFYGELSRALARPVTLRVCDPAFAVACGELLGLGPATPMVDVLAAIEDRFDALLADIQGGSR
jgi:hypothetical protein